MALALLEFKKAKGKGLVVEVVEGMGGLAWETQKETMKKYFEQFGEILEAVVITDKATGKSKGYGFVLLLLLILFNSHSHYHMYIYVAAAR